MLDPHQGAVSDMHEHGAAWGAQSRLTSIPALGIAAEEGSDVPNIEPQQMMLLPSVVLGVRLFGSLSCLWPWHRIGPWCNW